MQVFPKKCTYSAGEKGAPVVSKEASLSRIKTALAAKKEALEQDGNEVLVIARTDCRMALGFEEAIDRCLEYESMGADIVYAENLQSPDEYQTLRSKMSVETPMILAQVQLNDPAVQQQVYSLSEIHDMGYNFALMGVTALQATVRALEQTATSMLDHQGLVPATAADSLSSFSNLKQVVGFPEMEDFERRYYCE